MWQGNNICVPVLPEELGSPGTALPLECPSPAPWLSLSPALGCPWNMDLLLARDSAGGNLGALPLSCSEVCVSRDPAPNPAQVKG